MCNLFSVAEEHRSTIQFLRYGLVGIANNVSGYLLFLLITYWGLDPKKAMTALYLVGATIGFYGNRRWVFAHNGTLIGSGARYFTAHLFGYMINLCILLMFVDMLGYPYQWVQAAAIFVVAGFLFLAFKYFVFPKSERCDRGSK